MIITHARPCIHLGYLIQRNCLLESQSNCLPSESKKSLIVNKKTMYSVHIKCYCLLYD